MKSWIKKTVVAKKMMIAPERMMKMISNLFKMMTRIVGQSIFHFMTTVDIYFNGKNEENA